MMPSRMTATFLITMVLFTQVAQVAFAEDPDVLLQNANLSPTERLLLKRLQETEARLKSLEQKSAEKTSLPSANSAIDEIASPFRNASTNLNWLKDDDKESSKGEDEERFEDRIKSLEKNWASYEKAQDKIATKAKSKPTFKLGGRIHFDYWNFTGDTPGIAQFEGGYDPANRFQFRRIRLEAKGDVFDTMFYRLQVDFNNPSTPEYKDVYIGFKELPGNQSLIIGNQKRPMGLDHLNSSRLNIFMERPMVVEAFNPDARRMGVAMYGHTDDQSLIWAYGAYLLENTRSTGRAIGDSAQGSVNGRLAGSPWYDETSGGRGYFHWGVSAMAAKPDGDVSPTDINNNDARFATRPEARSSKSWMDTGRIAGADWYETVGIETILNIGSFQMGGEWQSTWMQRDNTTAGTGPDLNFQGGYVYVAYMLTGEHVPYSRKSGTIGRVKPFENFFLVDRCSGGTGSGWGAWQVAARYSYLDLSDGDITGGEGESMTLAFNWWWTSHSRMQFNAVKFTEENRGPVGGFTSGDAWIIGTRFMVDF